MTQVPFVTRLAVGACGALIIGTTALAEMRKGEQFVMGEVRVRARERIRWFVSLGLLAFAVLVAPVPWLRLRLRVPE